MTRTGAERLFVMLDSEMGLQGPADAAWPEERISLLKKSFAQLRAEDPKIIEFVAGDGSKTSKSDILRNP